MSSDIEYSCASFSHFTGNSILLMPKFRDAFGVKDSDHIQTSNLFSMFTLHLFWTDASSVLYFLETYFGGMVTVGPSGSENRWASSPNRVAWYLRGLEDGLFRRTYNTPAQMISYIQTQGCTTTHIQTNDAVRKKQ